MPITHPDGDRAGPCDCLETHDSFGSGIHERGKWRRLETYEELADHPKEDARRDWPKRKPNLPMRSAMCSVAA
jgi:hypothetical protein